MTKRFFLISLFVFCLIWGCSVPDTVSDEPVRIAISKAVPEKSYSNYGRWLRYGDSTVVYFDLYHLEKDSALALLATCDGLLLTGGTDIYPGRYGKEKDTVICWKPDFKRDTLETAALLFAMERNMPVFGICRGHQMINVGNGGSLFTDIPTDLGNGTKHQQPDTYDCPHDIRIINGSLLQKISGVNSGTVNSNHHQGIDIISEKLTGIAYTGDGLIESVELKDTKKQFMLGVQWHPERMDYNNPLSGKLAKHFLDVALKFKQENQQK